MKLQHENKLVEIDTANMDQLKVFESNFNMIQLENDNLKCKIETLINPEQLKQYENEIYLLKSQIEDMREQIDQNSNLLNQLNETKDQLNSLHNNFNQILVENNAFKSQLEQPKTEFNETIYLDQLKQYEANYISIQTENDELRAKLEETNIQVVQQNELKEKVNSLEQLNLKYKAKLKQLIAKSKITESSSSTTAHTNDLLMIDEQSSTNATPVNHSPMFHSPMVVVKTSNTQTDLNFDEILNHSTQLNIEIAELKQRLNQTLEEKNYLDEKNSKLESQKLEYENHITQLSEIKREEKIENTLLVKSNFNNDDEFGQLKDECKSLKERLETTQQQNLKLKAKLKNVLSLNKGEKSSKEQDNEKVKYIGFF